MRTSPFFLFFFLVFPAAKGVAQPTGGATAAADTVALKQLRSEVENLRTSMALVEGRQREQRENQVNTNQALYQLNRQKATAVLSTLEAVRSCNSILQKAVVQAENLSVVATISNPQSGALGFKLTDVVSANIKAQLAASTSVKDRDKESLIASISTVLGTVGQLLNPSSLVVQTVQTIASFLPGRVKEAANDPTGEKFANQFVVGMKPYLDYYDRVKVENDEHRVGLARLKSKFSSLNYDLRDLTAETGKNGVPPNQSTSRTIDLLFGIAGQPVDYEAVNNKDEVQYLVEISPDVYALTKQALEFHQEYNATIRTYLTNSLALLDEAKRQWPNNGVTIEQTKKAIVVSDLDPTGFSDLLRTITNNVNDLRSRRPALAAVEVTAPNARAPHPALAPPRRAPTRPR